MTSDRCWRKGKIGFDLGEGAEGYTVYDGRSDMFARSKNNYKTGSAVFGR